ncbi:CDS14 family ICE transfer lipoprotein [Mycoplasma sp. CSL7503-lung]|uniref:CDS14 family ICE transfer lipoprotein n=1 Tax=Mycoplasma sp. CSL7503-lung TaxID=536372 RepID=UPI0021D22C25|nr:hypothetical protein [Mycoplasma sp. CSL7503-lung]MCU4706436.1 hypothetical protein [Mycoplasma sp. CSL7503-lung]
MKKIKKFVLNSLFLTGFSSLGVSCFPGLTGQSSGIDKVFIPGNSNSSVDPLDQVDINLLDENRLFLKNVGDNPLLKNHQYYIKDAYVGENDYDISDYYDEGWKKYIQKPAFTFYEDSDKYDEKFMYEFYKWLKNQDAKIQGSDNAKGDFESEYKEYQGKSKEEIENIQKEQYKKHQWLKNNFAGEILPQGQLYSLIRDFLNNKNEKFSNRDKNYKFYNEITKYLAPVEEDINKKNELKTDISSWSAINASRNKKVDYFQDDKLDVYKNEYYRYFGYNPYFVGYSTSNSNKELYAKRDGNYNIPYYKFSVMLNGINSEDFSIIDQKFFQKGFATFSLAGNSKYLEKYSDWAKIIDSNNNIFSDYIKNLEFFGISEEVKFYSFINLLDVFNEIPAKNYLVENNEAYMYYNALKLDNYLYSLNVQDLKTYLEKESNKENIKQFKELLDKYSESLASFLGLESFIGIEMSSPHQNYKIAVDLFAPSGTSDFEASYRFAYKELLNKVLPLYTIFSSESEKLEKLLVIMNKSSGKFNFNSRNDFKGVYDYIFFILNYIYSNSDKFKLDRENIERINFLDYKFTLRENEKNKAYSLFDKWNEKVKKIY